jgi:hypothetical protein
VLILALRSTGIRLGIHAFFARLSGNKLGSDQVSVGETAGRRGDNIRHGRDAVAAAFCTEFCGDALGRGGS